MSTPGDSTERDPLDLLVEQFLQRHRKGESVDVKAFAAEHPAHATELRELLPTLQALEQVKREKESTGGSRARLAVPGLQQLGDFKIVRELGRGGMGVVFEAVQESLCRKVALKVLPQASLLTGNQLQRFLREAQIAAQLHHSNIVPVFGSGESDGYHWYAMQYIGGESLDHWRTQQAERPPQGSGAWRNRARFVARIGAQAASALHYAHSQGTMHRDVKPGNLLLDHDDHLWVTDFGLAKALEAEGLTHSGDLLGTLQYMAPEQFHGQYDARSEVYALGVTLYELLVLRPAFAAKSRSELMERVRTQRPEPLRRARPDVPEDLAIVVERAMARDPADRYADAHALEQDLQAFLEDRPIAARRQSALAQVLRWCRHNRGLSTLAGATLLAVVGAGVTGWYSYGVTAAALGQAKESKILAEQQQTRADATLRKTLDSYGQLFDALVGRDPMLALEEDLDTGEQTVIVRSVVEPGSIEPLLLMLRFYDEFAKNNEGDQALRFETARAWRRVGAIYVRLGKPENLDAAKLAYEQSLARFVDVQHRDVPREMAGVHLELGQLEQRRRSLAAAAQQFQRALTILDKEQSGEQRHLQFDRAQAHFLLAQLADPRAGGGPRGPGGMGGPGGQGGPGGAGAPGGREVGRVLQDSKQHRQEALTIVAQLLSTEPESRDYRALKARCLVLDLPWRTAEPGARDGDRPRDRVRGDRSRDPQQEAQRKEGLDIFRDLVAKYPQAEKLRFELCKALSEDRRRDAGRREGPQRGRRDAVPPSDAELAVLREARGHAEELVKVLPLLPEYAALRSTVGTLLGNALRDRSETLTEPAASAMRAEAKAELLAAAAIEHGLVDGSDLLDPRFVLRVVETRQALASLCLQMGARPEAVDHVRVVFDLLEQQVALLEGRPRAELNRPLSRFRFGEDGPLRISDRLLGALAAPELVERARQLQSRVEKLVVSERPEREPPAGPEPRRGGK